MLSTACVGWLCKASRGARSGIYVSEKSMVGLRVDARRASTLRESLHYSGWLPGMTVSNNIFVSPQMIFEVG